MIQTSGKQTTAAKQSKQQTGEILSVFFLISQTLVENSIITYAIMTIEFSETIKIMIVCKCCLLTL